ncbi:sulfurtransferase-like selenium metabolism protein YedF [Alkaliphilus crotonatoxidans]
MNRQVDARGMTDPLPVIYTKKALASIDQGVVTTIVDNRKDLEKISRLADHLTLKVDVQENQGSYYINIYKEHSMAELEGMDIEADDSPKKDLVIVVSGDCLGDGSRELGKMLMKGYLYALTETLPYPKTLIFLNSGVNLTVEGSDSIPQLRMLEANGVEILSCGACLDYYKLKDKLVVGGVGNMYTIVEKMNHAKNTIKL